MSKYACIVKDGQQEVTFVVANHAIQPEAKNIHVVARRWKLPVVCLTKLNEPTFVEMKQPLLQSELLST